MSQDNRKFTSPENGKLSQGPKTEEGKQRSAGTPPNSRRFTRTSSAVTAQGPLEEQLVFDMTSLLWRKRRCAPAETALMDLQMQRMSLSVNFEFESITPEARFAVAFNALHSNGESATHLARHERLLFRQFQAIRAELIDLQNNRPPSTGPEPPREDPVTAETNLTPVEPVETKLAPTTNCVVNPLGSLYSSLPPVANNLVRPLAETDPSVAHAKAAA